MTSSFTLTVTERTERGKQLGKLRSEGRLPAVMYGPKEAPVLISVDRVEFEKLFKNAGESSVITLQGLSTPKEVLVHDVAFDVARGGATHVDFYAIEAGKEITVHVPLEFTGEAPAVKLGGTLTKVIHEIEVTCMPKNLPQHIVVDVSSLVDFESRIEVKDLIIPSGVTLEGNLDELVVLVQPVEEEKEAETGAVDMSAIEVQKKGKTDTENA